jgi:hypothetical protein
LIDSCGNYPHLKIIIENDSESYSSESLYNLNTPVSVSLPSSGTYQFTLSVLYDLTSIQKETITIYYCLYSLPVASSLIIPQDNAIYTPGTTVTFQVSSFSNDDDWGESCSQDLGSNTNYYEVQVTNKATSDVFIVTIADNIGTETFSEEGEYEIIVFTVLGENFVSQSSSTTLTICSNKDPSAPELRLGDTLFADGSESVELLTEDVTVSLSSGGYDCSLPETQANVFTAIVYSFSATTVTDFASAKAATQKTLEWREEDISTTTFSLPVFEASTFYKLVVIAYTESQFQSSSTSVYFSTRAAWCDPNPCVHGTCNELTKSCSCSADYTGDLCDLSVGTALLAVAIVAPVVLVVIIFCIVAFFLKRRYDVVAKRKKLIKQLKYTRVKMLMEAENIDWKTIEERLFTSSTSPTFDFALVKQIVSVTSSTESDLVAKCLVYAFAKNGFALSLFQELITDETKSAEKQTLFRSNSMATKLFKIYSRIVGLDYLLSNFAFFLDKLCRQDESQLVVKNVNKDQSDMMANYAKQTEFHGDFLNPDNATNGVDLETDYLEIELLSQKVLDHVVRTQQKLPPEITQILHSVRTEVEKSFPDSVAVAVSAFVFLRFINNALSVPESYGLLVSPPPELVRKRLIYVCKVLQTLANGAKFGAKEDFMVHFNSFIENNTEKMKRLISFAFQYFLYSFLHLFLSNSLFALLLSPLFIYLHFFIKIFLHFTSLVFFIPATAIWIGRAQRQSVHCRRRTTMSLRTIITRL